MANNASLGPTVTIGLDLLTDTSPQLGANLDVNGNSIVSTSNGNIAITPNGSGKVVIDGLSHPTSDGSTGQFLKTDGSGNLSFASISGGDVVDDTSPQLGGDLDLNSNNITGTGQIPDANLTGTLPALDGSSLTGNTLKFVRVSSAHSGAAAVRYIKVATIDSSTPSESSSTFVFRILLEGRDDLQGASQFRVHIRTGNTAARSSVVVEQEHSNRHTYFGKDSFIFFWNSQSNSEFWVKIPNNSDVAYLELFAKLEVSAPTDTTYVSGESDVTIHTSQSWTTSAPSGTNEITAEWIKKRFDSIIFEGTTTDNYETFLQATDPTAVRTITLPNATGTVSLTSATETLTNKTLTSPTITGLASTTVEVDEQIFTSNGTWTKPAGAIITYMYCIGGGAGGASGGRG